MTEWRPFVVRRTTLSQDVLRSLDPVVQSALRYGARIVKPEEVEAAALLTRPLRYDSAIITVQIPADIPWTKAVLIRGGFGNPTTPQDGVPVWYTEEVPEGTDPTKPDFGLQIYLSQEVLDTPLTPPNWYYYTLFLWVGNQWVFTEQAEVLVPKDWGWGDLLFTSIPPFYQKMDDEQAVDGRNGTLRRWTHVLGYELDYTQCWIDGLLHVYAVDRAPMKLVKLLGDNFGFPYEAVLGGNRTRSVLEQLDDLNSMRGTRLGLQRLITAASEYLCDIERGHNELLALDDGDFYGEGGVPNIDPTTLPPAELMRWGIGHWDALTDVPYLTNITDPVTPAQNAAAAATTPAILAKNYVAGPGSILTPPGGRGAMVINGKGPETVVACGHINKDGDPDMTLLGALTSGVPVTPGALYEFSVETIRTTWGTAGQNPPQARVILGILWFSKEGWLIDEPGNTGPVLPDNYDLGTWKRTYIQAYAIPPYDADTGEGYAEGAFYAVPVIWWRHAGTWAGAWTDVNTPPTFGRYISMVNFGKVRVEGEDVVPIPPDVYLTLGTSKMLAGPQSRLGEPNQ